MVKCNTVDFIHEYSGVQGRKSSCHIRILNGEGKPITVICSQLPSNNGTSVTNVAENIAAEIYEQIDSSKKTLRNVIKDYFDEHQGYEMVDHLIKKLKESGGYSLFFLEILKQALKFSSESKLAAERIKNLVWVEHYPIGAGLHPTTHEYSVVRFNEETWEPNWTKWVTETAFSKFTGYSVKDVTLAGVKLT